MNLPLPAHMIPKLEGDVTAVDESRSMCRARHTAYGAVVQRKARYLGHRDAHYRRTKDGIEMTIFKNSGEQLCCLIITPRQLATIQQLL